MASKPLTEKGIQAAKPGNTRREMPDGASPGLYLVVQTSGKKSWALRYRIGERTRKMTLGAYPLIGLAEARKKALAAQEIVAEGMDPATIQAEAKQEQRSDMSLVENVLTKFVESHVSRRRDSTVTETKRLIEKNIMPKWRGRTIRSIRKADVLDLLDPLLLEGKGYLANRVFAVVRKFGNWCVEREIIGKSFATGMKPPADEVSRDRVLSDTEIKSLWRASEIVGWPWEELVKVLLLTGQRREEVASMSWAELSLKSDAPYWLIPRHRAKNDKEHLVPLAPLVVAIVKGAKRVDGDGDFVLSTNGDTAISGFSKSKARLDAAMLAELKKLDPKSELKPWRFHDLRRTAVSGMAALGHPVQVVEAVINHKSGSVKGVAAIYNRYDYADEKSHALLDWANRVSELVSDNVVALKSRA